LIDKRFAELAWPDEGKMPGVYAIGGSFRALAKMHMAATDYPLRILHEYTVEGKEFSAFLQEISSLSNAKLDKLPGVSSKRVAALPGAAMVLERIIKQARPKHVVFSASGIREGYLYEKLPTNVRSQDGLLASCTEFATKGG